MTGQYPETGITRKLAWLHLDVGMIRFYDWWLFHPVGAFKRWMWTRCAWCGQGFPFRNWPTVDMFEDEINQLGPQPWFESEQRIYHSECYDRKRGR